jgi:serine/threonine-protein kinase ATR
MLTSLTSHLISHSRMMEFCGVVNRMFENDPRARRRKLRLRTYAVTCLNESCGLLEWVENTEGFRNLVTKVYQTEGLTSLNRQAFSHYRTALEQKQVQDGLPTEERVTWYRERILSEFPPRFHKWFLRAFPDPAQWLEARALYIKSAATWSMVGHIIGLGDRHAENLLIDVKRGECVHVDFDCLFDKGLKLQRPEIVPFRLTPHVVDGLDLGGVEGVYRTYCDVALGVLRGNKDALMSVLESFAVDPLVEWTR